jgi:hypothetical protein
VDVAAYRHPTVTGRRAVWVLAAAAVVAGLAASACSDDDSGGGESDDGASAAGGGSTTTLAVAAADAPFCDAFGALLIGPLSEAATDATDPEVLRGAVEVTAGLLVNLADSAPPEVQASAAALADEYAATFEILERYGFDLSRLSAEATPEEQEVLESFGQPAAGPGASDPFSQLEAFVADHCAPGLTVPEDLTNP